MKFDKIVNTILENKALKKRFSLIDPFDYSEIIMRQPILDDKGRARYELHKVTKVMKKPEGDYGANNLQFIKTDYLEHTPEEVEKNWVRKDVVYGIDIIIYYKTTGGDIKDIKDVDPHSAYIVHDNTKNTDNDDSTTVHYLKPSNIAGDVKDTFSDLYSEL